MNTTGRRVLTSAIRMTAPAKIAVSGADCYNLFLTNYVIASVEVKDE